MRYVLISSLLGLSRTLGYSVFCVSRATWCRQSAPALSSSSSGGGVEESMDRNDCDVYDVQLRDSKCIRYVKPYFQDFRTHAKGRWIGREIVEVFCREFGAHPKQYWMNAISNGQVKINGQIVGEDYRFRNSDSMVHRTHRHEPPIFGAIALVGETVDLLAICKPPSMPMHPCGAYRHNSLEYILKQEKLVENQPPLYIVHRLDRVTSGLVVLAKSKVIAARISEQIRDKATTKIYLARVKGVFPTSVNDVRHLKAVSSIDLREFGDDVEDSIDVPELILEANSSQRRKRKQRESNDQYGKGAAVDAATLPPAVRSVRSAAEVGHADNVGIMFQTSSLTDTERSPSLDQSMVVSAMASADPLDHSSELWVRCPIGVVSQRDGVHACDPDGKPSLSIFRCLGYDPDSDTSLVACRPYTGRTHQLRLHLQLLGVPIANDPCYGGELFYGNADAKSKALQAISQLRTEGTIPLSKIPHMEGYSNTDLSSLEATSDAVGQGPHLLEHPLEGEGEDEYLMRTCRYCRENSSLELEQLLHCDGIWLHALKYAGPPGGGSSGTDSCGWSFQAPDPVWATPFRRVDAV